MVLGQLHIYRSELLSNLITKALTWASQCLLRISYLSKCWIQWLLFSISTWDIYIILHQDSGNITEGGSKKKEGIRKWSRVLWSAVLWIWRDCCTYELTRVVVSAQDLHKNKEVKIPAACKAGPISRELLVLNFYQGERVLFSFKRYPWVNLPCNSDGLTTLHMWDKLIGLRRL